jgi:hypothetical protein
VSLASLPCSSHVHTIWLIVRERLV